MTLDNKTKTIFVATFVIMLGVSTSSAYAAHPLPTEYVFSSANKSVCYQMTALGTVKVDGQTNQATLLKSEVEVARQHVDSNTDINIAFDSVCNSGDNQVSAQYYQDTNINGVTQAFNVGQSSLYKIIWYNGNSAKNYSTSSICTAGQDVSPRFIANHEFGHFTGLKHPNNEWLVPSGHTMMKSFCSNDYAAIKIDDKNQINGLY